MANGPKSSNLLKDASSGVSAALVVRGDAGIGKSALLDLAMGNVQVGYAIESLRRQWAVDLAPHGVRTVTLLTGDVIDSFPDIPELEGPRQSIINVSPQHHLDAGEHLLRRLLRLIRGPGHRRSRPYLPGVTPNQRRNAWVKLAASAKPSRSATASTDRSPSVRSRTARFARTSSSSA